MRSLGFLCVIYWIFSSYATYGADSKKLIDYSVEDILVIRDVAIASYQSKRVKGLELIDDIFNPERTKRLAQIYLHSNFLIIGYECLQSHNGMKDLFLNKARSASIFGLTGSLWESYTQCALNTKNHLLAILQEHPLKNIIFTGFQSGAAIANLAALDIQLYLNSSPDLTHRKYVMVTTFCGYTPGDQIFMSGYKTIIPLYNTLSFVDHGDSTFDEMYEEEQIGLPIRIPLLTYWSNIVESVKQNTSVLSKTLLGWSKTTTAIDTDASILMAEEPYNAPSKQTIRDVFNDFSLLIRKFRLTKDVESIDLRLLTQPRFCKVCSGVI
ncbi:MAG: hypothetical protein EBY20_03150 [Alphaproteobacteria bacterium]|nr:hypothetical protein [Alphaproteobacteria bacterium]